MTTTARTLEELSNAFQINDHISFSEKSDGFIIASLNTLSSTASVAVHGGHVLSFIPSGQEPVLWLSEYSHFREGKAIRGGIPVIWPWFGPHRADESKPSHGFARTRFWEVHSTRLIDEAFPQIRLQLTDNAITRELWPYAFLLELVITLSDTLQVDLVIENTGKTLFEYTGALHSYFNVSQIQQIKITGLEGVEYIDQLAPDTHNIQQGPIKFAAETDNIYLDTPHTCKIVDPGYDRTIVVEKSGSLSTVVWNPWIAKSARMSDFGDNEYNQMVCIEAANAATDIIRISPRQRHTLSTTLSVE